MATEFINRSRVKDNFTTLPNSLITDDRLSSDGLALLVYLLSKPADWRVQVTDIRNRFGWGKDKTYSIIRGLEQFGYMSREWTREAGRFGGNLYYVSDSPFPDFPDTVKPDTENKDHTKERYIQKKDYNNSIIADGDFKTDTETDQNNQARIENATNKQARIENAANNQARIKSAAKQTVFSWSPDDEDRQYAADLGLDADDILLSIRLWDEQNGNKASYASVKAFWQGWCRREAKRAERGLKRQQSTFGNKGTGDWLPGSKMMLSPDQWHELSKSMQTYYRNHRPDLIQALRRQGVEA